jgi:hypothetical protein
MYIFYNEKKDVTGELTGFFLRTHQRWFLLPRAPLLLRFLRVEVV